MSFGPLVTSQWLADEAGAADLVIFDASAYLPNEPHDAAELYRKAHIPGARRFDIDEFSDPDTPLPHMVPSQGRFARLIGAAGVDQHSRVVVYDQKGLFSAARAWWLLRYFGHTQVAVLDGGLPQWLAEGRPVASGEPAMAQPRTFNATVHTRLLKGLGDVLEAVHLRNALVLDARASNRFDGSTAEVRPGVAAGHIPGSRNLPYTQLLQADHRLRPAAELRQLVIDAGADSGKPLITSCGSGVTATILLLALAVAGLPEGGLYDGSWTEWGSREDTPKAKGGI